MTDRRCHVFLLRYSFLAINAYHYQGLEYPISKACAVGLKSKQCFHHHFCCCIVLCPQSLHQPGVSTFSVALAVRSSIVLRTSHLTAMGVCRWTFQRLQDRALASASPVPRTTWASFMDVSRRLHAWRSRRAHVPIQQSYFSVLIGQGELRQMTHLMESGLRIAIFEHATSFDTEMRNANFPSHSPTAIHALSGSAQISRWPILNSSSNPLRT